ncbi:hypothetical protein PR048_019938 [Dryococelus australis]|uniref:Uncharacterized protein n=1 Tax=Dryococelus australis TaxID=614101 RepID=A0ABQ9H4V8_9NEOP|nr:hypothetical protein PR048_019938 [Dryococelus australis]
MPDRTFQIRRIKHKYESVLNRLFSTQRMIYAHYALKNCSQEEEIQLHQEYDDHQKEKRNLSRKVKENDIAASREQSSDNNVFCFDIQAVIPLSRGNVSIFYYKRKLKAFNFTIYDETNEWKNQHHTLLDNISHQCIFKLSKILFNVLHKNTSFSGTLKMRVMPCTLTLRGRRNQALKKCSYFFPSQIATVAQVALTTGKPYTVQQVDTTAILDWKSFYSSNCKKINVKVCEVRKNTSSIIFYKTSYEEEEMKEILLPQSRPRGRQ